MTALTADDIAGRLAAGALRDPFSVLGMHEEDGGLIVRVFLPGASSIAVVDRASGEVIAVLPKQNASGLFAGAIERARPFPYRLRVITPSGVVEIEDAYRFGSMLGEIDIDLLAAGSHFRSYNKLGAHPIALDGVEGVGFAVWAPNARSVSVVGRFNEWDRRCHPMRLRPEAGVWEIFIPGLAAGESYNYDITGPAGERLPLKADPCGFFAEHPPATASIVHDPGHFAWHDQEWMARREQANAHDAPIAIYEVHLGSWQRHGDGRYLSYRELADTLVPYVRDLGFTHIELLPISEHPMDGSWGYQPLGLFAPTSRFGTPDEFRHFVQCCHAADIGVLIDWVAGHFPSDPHGLGFFDGTHLYDHADARLGLHPDWNTLIYDFGRREVAAFLISNALFWIAEFHIDGLRVDAVSSMLYLDYSRKDGEWVPNKFGGRENLEAIAFLRRLNEVLCTEGGGAITIAEESTAWPMVSRPADTGGLGFGYKWNLGWMHDTLRYMITEPQHRRYYHGDLIFGFLYGFSENFVLSLSHDEVVHGKRSILGRMPGDRWRRFANLRAYYGFMWCHPGKKSLFMGAEFGQEREWDHDGSLDWQLLDDPIHRGVQQLVRDLNRIYRTEAALHRLDASADGFAWIEADDSERSCLAFLRRGLDPREIAVIVCNFTPEPRLGYRIGVPWAGRYVECLNTDATEYGGSGMGNWGEVQAEPVPSHGHSQSVMLTLPPLSTTIFVWARN